MEIPGTIIVLFLISRVSRLKILIGGNILSGVSLLLITLITNANVRIFLASLGLVGMAISFPTVYLYSCEVFPTVVRNVGVGLGSISARIGSIIAPYIATMVIYVLFLCFSIFFNEIILYYFVKYIIKYIILFRYFYIIIF